MRQRREVTQLEIGIARDVVHFADGGEHVRLLDRIDAQVRFEIQIQIQQVRRVAGLYRQQGQDTLLHRIAGPILFSGCRGGRRGHRR